MATQNSWGFRCKDYVNLKNGLTHNPAPDMQCVGVCEGVLWWNWVCSVNCNSTLWFLNHTFKSSIQFNAIIFYEWAFFIKLLYSVFVNCASPCTPQWKFSNLCVCVLPVVSVGCIALAERVVWSSPVFMKINEQLDIFSPLSESIILILIRPMGSQACGTHTVATGCMLNVQVVINAKKLAIDFLYLCNSLSIGLLFLKIPISVGWKCASNIASGTVLAYVCMHTHCFTQACLCVQGKT